MITFRNLGQHGRLGNQLFQYAALKALSLHNNYEIRIPSPKKMSHDGQKCLLRSFNITAKDLDDNSVTKNTYHEKNGDIFDANFFKIQDNTNLQGFFQHCPYFDKYKKQILGELSLRADILTNIQKVFEQTYKKDDKQIVSIHVRRGDVVDNPVYHNFYGNNDVFSWDSIYGQYLTRALKHVDVQNSRFVIFTGGSKENDYKRDVNWCKEVFGFLPEYHVANHNSEITDFGLISMCDVNINCHATTFGWWASYINAKSVVIAPKYYFIERQGYFRETFYPKDWILA